MSDIRTRLSVLIICFLIIFIATLPAFSQFKGKDRKIADNIKFKNFQHEQHKSMLVPAKKTMGLFWKDPNKNFYFAQISKRGTIKGKVKKLDEVNGDFHVVWIGDSYIVALVKYHEKTAEFLVYLSKYKESGVRVGGYTIPQIKFNTDPGGWWSTHRPCLTWNGKEPGLAYLQQNFNGENMQGVYFHRMNKNRQTLGQRQLVTTNNRKPASMFMASAKKEFLAGLRDDWASGGIFLQRFNKSGAKVGKLTKVGEGAAEQMDSNFLMASTGNGYAVVYSHFMKGLRILFLDSKLKMVKGPYGLNNDQLGWISYNHMVVHKGVVWIVYKELADVAVSRTVRSLSGSKAKVNSNLLVYKPLITKEFVDYEDFPFGLASFGKFVYFAFIRYEPDHEETEVGTVYIRKMKN